MKTAKIYQYQLPMDSGVILREQRLQQRDGLVIELSDGIHTARGEVAPLPEFSQETLEQAREDLISLTQSWLNNEELDLDSNCPSVAFGFSMALLELEKQLPQEGNYQAAPLCSGDPDDLVVKLNEMSGKKIAKIKVGLYEPIRDGMVANMFLELIPDLSLRLDANRNWTPKKAEQFANYVHPQFRSRIEFLEEPCNTPEESLAFSKATNIAIAWDETVRDDGFTVEAQEGVTAIVIKPTLVGSVEKCISLIEKAHQLGMQAVISSSIESSLALTQLARLAAWKTPETIPGLDTIDLFKMQLDAAWPNCDLPVAQLADLEVIWEN
ncbi:o-succinylbenzoate synthase [Aliivibrio fischeri]|uniref:o-succinylbenzoate synthase n=1 Tax=Aliivibrio fischeri TaxID=668 RepID=UPI0012DAEA1F|nr:o-succinylbenzoate synthase [Aliivibrio fischeri]MUK68694.1 o-succinylbenzoate synthase [Aliivibrio fischeri]MUK73006.1 o-succinylbenzoate synthase [Aliivibrio fischeri]